MAQTTINGQTLPEHTHTMVRDGKVYWLEADAYELEAGDVIFCVPDDGNLALVKRTVKFLQPSCQKWWEDQGFDDPSPCDCYPEDGCSLLVSTVEDDPDQRYTLFWKVVATA